MAARMCGFRLASNGFRRVRGVSTFGPAPAPPYRCTVLAVSKRGATARRRTRCHFRKWSFKNRRDASISAVYARCNASFAISLPSVVVRISYPGLLWRSSVRAAAAKTSGRSSSRAGRHDGGIPRDHRRLRRHRRRLTSALLATDAPPRNVKRVRELSQKAEAVEKTVSHGDTKTRRRNEQKASRATSRRLLRVVPVDPFLRGEPVPSG